MRSLNVSLNDIPVGALSEDGDLWRFTYAPAWQQDPAGFDLSPALPRNQREHIDGATTRTVQWYFDNLLPEEAVREAISKDAGLVSDDAFGLLTLLGAESAGSLVLLPPGATPPTAGDLKPLSDSELCTRIRNLPRRALSSDAPKKMSVAGAQHKLLVVYRNGTLFEPVGTQPSTHLLKPNHPSDDYPASVINEYLVMRLARTLGLAVPDVRVHYTPEPVYIVDRFDRVTDEQGQTRRLHIIDACQLLNKGRSFKYSAARLEALEALASACRSSAATRLALFQWLVFNLLVGNHDNHLKNLSFWMSAEGVQLAPFYDLVATAAYDTRAFADQRAIWPDAALAIPLPGAERFADIARDKVLAAAEVLKVPGTVAARELDRQLRAIGPALDELVAEQQQDTALPEGAAVFLGGQRRLADVLRHIVVADTQQMLGTN